MKKIYLLIAAFTFSNHVFSQVWWAPKYDSLTLNEVEAPITNNADFTFSPTRYFVPRGSNSSPLFAASMWIGGFNNGSLHVAATTTRHTGYSLDFYPGPVDTTGLALDTNTIKSFTGVWKVNRFDIANYLYHWNAGNVQNGTFIPPASILNWPAHGMGGYSRRLAPFVDVNNNGIYDPIHDGDYPKMKGDQMIWWVFNDSAKHNETAGAPFGVEVHASAYVYTCPGLIDSTSIINYTTFFNYDIINRSGVKYDSCIMGLWLDTDLGNYLDDYIGCDVMHNFGYTYNGDNYDDDAAGITGYHSNLPEFSCNILAGPLADVSDGRDNNNNGYIDETNEQCLMNKFSYYTNTGDPLMGNPSATGNGIQYYNFLNSHWRNGVPMTYGANGTVSTNTPCSHAYPGNSDPYGISMGGSIANPVSPTGNYGTTGWTEGQAGVVKNDMRFLIGMGPFTMQPGEHNNVDYALVFTQGNTSNNLGAMSTAVKNSMMIKNWFVTDSFPSCLNLAGVGIKENANQTWQVNVYPNPANNYVFIEFTESFEKVIVEVYDMLGNIVKAGIFNEARKYIAMPIDDIANGMYSIKIRSGNKLITKKFVKK